MTPQVISLSSLGSTVWIPVDYKQNPFNIGLACVVSNTPNLTYQVEFTLDDIFNPSITPTAFTHSLLVGKTSDFSSNQTVPVRAIRLTTTAYTSGTVTLTALQGGVNPIIYTPNPVTLFQSGIPFWIPPGDGGVNGLSFTDAVGNFTLSAAVMTNFWNFLNLGGYCYLPAGAGGLATGGWFWCKMTSDTAGTVYANTYSGSGKPEFVASPTALSGITTGRITQVTTEVNGPSFVNPGGSMGENGLFELITSIAGDSSATIKTYRIRAGSTVMLQAATSTNSVADYAQHVRNRGVQTAQICSRSAGIGNGGTSLGGAWQYAAVDMSVDQTMMLSLQISANTGSAALLCAAASVRYGA